ncbi:MAG: hypothetical protein Q9178_005005 [Gyalolechia marmorata]
MASPLIQQGPSMPLIKGENPDLMVRRTDGEVSTRKVEFGGKDKIGSTMVEILESIAAMRSHNRGTRLSEETELMAEDTACAH